MLTLVRSRFSSSRRSAIKGVQRVCTAGNESTGDHSTRLAAPMLAGTEELGAAQGLVDSGISPDPGQPQPRGRPG